MPDRVDTKAFLDGRIDVRLKLIQIGVQSAAIQIDRDAANIVLFEPF